MLVENDWFLFFSSVHFAVGLSISSFHTIYVKYSVVVSVLSLINKFLKGIVIEFANFENRAKFVHFFNVL